MQSVKLFGHGIQFRNLEMIETEYQGIKQNKKSHLLQEVSFQHSKA